MSNFCYTNKIICEDASSNGYCSLTACRNIRLCGNTITSEGIYPVEEIKADWSKKPSNWHTGTPTEEGWYLCKSEHMVGYDVGYYFNGRFNRLHCFNQGDITEWQKIED